MNLRKTFWALLLIGLAGWGKLPGQAGQLTFSPAPASTRLENNSDLGFELSFNIPSASLESVASKGGAFSQLLIEGYGPSGRIGEPELPVLSKLIAVPLGASVSFEVISSQERLFSQAESGLEHPLVPAQPSLFKNQDPDSVPFEQNQASYSRDGFTDNPLFRLEEVGMMRGVRVFQFYFEPARYNPASGELKITHQASIRVDFSGGDPAATEELLRKTASFEFEKLYRATLFNWRADDRDWVVRTPVKMLILCPPNYTSYIQPFVDWKNQQGIQTTVTTVGTGGTVVNSPANIKSHLQTLWNNATAGNPMPTYLLIVGDVNGTIPIVSNTGATGTHPTDLTYARLNGTDYLPELYYGRFSVASSTELQQVVSKTIIYEKTEMPSLAYLDNVVLIAGADSYYGPVHGNGQVNYGTYHYFNTGNGIYSDTYLYPASETSDAAILANANAGRGYMNYTAHGWEGGWGDPSFTTSDVAAMTNLDKYGVMVGNACLTSKFDYVYGPCFGEALIRRGARGAVGYIGASNSTQWSQDYWWAVGYKTPQAAAHPYDATKLGAYDAMFHTHGENHEDWATNLGQTVYMGNSAVQQSSADNKSYYWEIYNVMGDPSLSTYLGLPGTMSVTHTESVTPNQINTVQVATGVPYAYVGISWNGSFVAGGYASNLGWFTTDITPVAFREYTVTVTAPNKVTYEGTIYSGHIWTGDNSEVWNTAANWNCGTVPTTTSHVLIPDDATRNPTIGTSAAYCYSLTVETGASLHIYSNNLYVGGNVYMAGYLIMNAAKTFDVNGHFYWQDGSTAQISDASAQIFCAGNMTFAYDSDIQFAQGYLEFDGPNNSYLYNYSPNTRLYNIRSDVEGDSSFYISLNCDYDIHIDGTFRNYDGCRSYCNYAGNVYLKGSFYDYNEQADRGVRWNFGTLVACGTASQTISLEGADAYIQNLTVNSSGTVSLGGDLEIRGSFVLSGGIFNASSYTVKVMGDWTNPLGPTAFSEVTSRVVFNGTAHQYVNGSETFNILEVANGAALRFSTGSAVSCAVYDWSSGGIDVNASGVTFTAQDLEDNGIAGGWWLSAASAINLYNPSPNDWVDLKGTLYISNGTFNVHGGSTASYWPYNGNGSITMSGGVLDFKDQGVYVYDPGSYTFSENITGGTIRVAGGFNVERYDFNPSGGTVELVGSIDGNLSHYSGSNFHKVTINKTVARTGGLQLPEFETDREGNAVPVTRTAGVNITDCLINNGLHIISANLVNINGIVTCANAINNYVANATLKVNAATFTSTGHLYMQSGGTLELVPGANVQIANAKAIYVQSGGRLQSIGDAAANATFNVYISGHYGLQVLPGGTIAAAYTSFQKLNGYGLYLAQGSTVDTSYPFDNCEFRDGAIAGYLIWIDSDQSFTVTNASFPTNAGSNARNVYKSSNGGHVYFSNWSGVFGGPAYENDTYNRVWWSGSGIPPVETVSISYMSSLNAVRLNWSYPFPATRYNIYRSAAPDGIYVYQGYTTNLTWSQTVPGDRYFYFLKAVGP